MDLRSDSASGVREWEEPWAAPFDHGTHHPVRYELGERRGRTFDVAVFKSPPEDLLLSVEIVQEEDGAFYMRAIEVDVSVEGANAAEALRELSGSVRDWLEYIGEEELVLAPELEHHRRYLALLDFGPLTWFRARTAG